MDLTRQEHGAISMTPGIILMDQVICRPAGSGSVERGIICIQTETMAANQWVGNYYLTDSGAMAVNQWIGNYYVGSDGAWIPDMVRSGYRIAMAGGIVTATADM